MAVISDSFVVVTGANRGLGLEFVRQLLAADNTVIATVRDVDGATELQQLAAKHASKLHITRLDVASSESVATWAASLRDNVQHVDYVVNNAGVLLDHHDGGLDELDADTLLLTVKINTLGPLMVVQQLLRQGLAGGDRPTYVINVSTILAAFGEQYELVKSFKCYTYRASKAALNIVVRNATPELAARNVHMTLIHPGYVDTDMNAKAAGTISTSDSVKGIQRVLSERGWDVLSGRFFSYDGSEFVHW